MAYPVARPPRRRPGRWQPALGVLLILAVLLVVADRVAAAAASRQMRTRVAAELARNDVSYGTLDVGVGGTPFLTQVAERRFTSITIDMTRVHVSAEGRDADLPSLHVVASGVQVDGVAVLRGRSSTVTSESVSGDGLVSYDTLSRVLDLSQYHLTDLRFEERDGKLWAGGRFTLQGMSLPVEAAANVSVSGGRIQLVLRDARAVGVTLPDVAVSALDQLVNAVFEPDLPPLPFGITVDSLQVKPEGLAVAVTGHDIALAAPAQGP